MLLQLAPGLRVVRRGPAHLQIGLYDERRVVLPRTVATLDLLARIGRREPVDLAEPGAATVVAQLVASGCAQPPTALEQRTARRRRARLALMGELGPPDGAGPDPAALLRAAGLGPPVALTDDPHAVLVLAQGEPDRAQLDPFLRSGTPHLLVRVVDGGVVVGPFVVPGRSACLRCVDARRCDTDPDHPSVLARYGAATRAARGDGCGDLAEPVLLQLALAWAVRDLVVHLDGDRPGTWSRTVRLGPEPTDLVRTAWDQHPQCGCCWPGPVGT
jgi:bacteriocin biosynthesis cyclodehydratase domain-containing protein